MLSLVRIVSASKILIGKDTSCNDLPLNILVPTSFIKKDIRFLKSETYSHYWFLSIQGYLGKRGDSYDRFLIRLREMYESVNIVFQIF